VIASPAVAQVTVRLYGAYSEMAGARKLTIDGATIADVLDTLPSKLPGLRERIRDEHGRIRDHLNVFRNEDEIRRLEGDRTTLSDGDIVHLIPAMSGGL
jgi:molybdopterin synthase sulfur carrier subunit